MSAFRTALRCSFRRCVKVLPVCPMYVRGQLVQGMRYTTPDLSCWETWSLGCTRSCRKVLIGRKVVLMPRGDRTRLMASVVPLMSGIVAEVVALEDCEREGESCEGWEWQ